MIHDLIEDKSKDGMYLQSWRDEEFVYLVVEFITLFFSISEFKDVTNFVKKTNSLLKDEKYDESSKIIKKYDKKNKSN
jgi:hypothetical protein